MAKVFAGLDDLVPGENATLVPGVLVDRLARPESFGQFLVGHTALLRIFRPARSVEEARMLADREIEIDPYWISELIGRTPRTIRKHVRLLASGDDPMIVCREERDDGGRITFIVSLAPKWVEAC